MDETEDYFRDLEQRLAKKLKGSPKAAWFAQVTRRSYSSDDELLAEFASHCIHLVMNEARLHFERSRRMLSSVEEGRSDRVKILLRSLSDLRTHMGDTISAQFESALEAEIGQQQAWLDALKVWGNVTTRKNFDYIEAGWGITQTLRNVAFPYPAQEAVKVLWHGGYAELQGPVNVIDPHKTYSRQEGKDPRDAPEREAVRRWERYEELIERHPSFVLDREDLDGYLPVRFDHEPVDWEPGNR